MANSVDPDQMPHTLASDLGLHCLLKPVCPNIYSYYSIISPDKESIELDKRNVQIFFLHKTILVISFEQVHLTTN